MGTPTKYIAAPVGIASAPVYFRRERTLTGDQASLVSEALCRQQPRRSGESDFGLETLRQRVSLAAHGLSTLPHKGVPRASTKCIERSLQQMMRHLQAVIDLPQGSINSPAMHLPTFAAVCSGVNVEEKTLEPHHIKGENAMTDTMTSTPSTTSENGNGAYENGHTNDTPNTGDHAMEATAQAEPWTAHSERPRENFEEEQRNIDYAAQVTAIRKTQAVIEFKPDGTITFANDLFLQTVGYSMDEIRGQHHSMFMDPTERRSPEYRKFWEALNRGEFQDGEFRRVGKGGKEIWLRASYSPLTDANGRTFKVVKYATEIGEKKRLELEQARIHAMVENVPINIMMADLDFNITYANPATINTLKKIEHFLPIKATQIVGSNIDIFHKHPAHQRRILTDPKNLPHRAAINIGDEIAELLVNAIYDNNRNYLGPMVTWELITARKNLEKQIDNAGIRFESLTTVCEQMGANAEETSTQANVVAAAAEQVSKNIETVATAATEMSASIKEIASNASQAATVALEAVRAAEETNKIMSKLNASSSDIGKVIKVITSIAQQTNLLALNATIEAARAGEAGKGFAVVANEVKELAKETAKATEDIGQKIDAIQGDTNSAVGAIERIGTIINQISDIQSTIAGAVEEQTATTNEIGRNVAEAAKGSSEIAENISGVAQAAQHTSAGASEVLLASKEVSKVTEQMKMALNHAD
jgi:methyl-accepting chemotaxis protein